MQIMKKELDEGYTNVISEVQREQTRLQARCDQLKQQLSESQQTIEQLKSSLNRLKNNRLSDRSKVTEVHATEKMTADIFTKSLGRILHERHCQAMGMMFRK